MKITGIGWAGTRTTKNVEMVAFCKDVLGMEALAPVEGQWACIEAFGFPSGQSFEVVGAEYDELAGWNGPKVEFSVDDVVSARAEMEAKGVRFINPVEVYTREDGTVLHWTNFVAPDGYIYGLFEVKSDPGRTS